MRYYVVCSHHGNHPIYFASNAQVRGELDRYFSLYCPLDNQADIYYRGGVEAEPVVGGTAGGAILGGLIGVLGGPIGVILGGMAGGALGGSAEAQERTAAARFNASPP
jgi:hypothetical protein